MNQKGRLFAFLTGAFLISLVCFVMAKPVSADGWETAYQVAFTHWDPWYEPHYGAYFEGCNGSYQYFTGPSGAPPDYGSWDWWGTCYHVLLLSKSWLFANDCGGTTCNDRWDGDYHHAFTLSP